MVCLVCPVAEADADGAAEKVEYMTGMQRVVRTDPLKRHLLLSVKHEDDGPLLPIISDDPRAFFASPLFPALEHSLDAAAFDSVPTGDPLPDEIAHDARVALDRLASDFMGPGPWTLDLTLPLPANCAQLRPSNKNRRANVLVSHTLRVVFRVERSDPPATPPPKGKEGEKHGKLFDIVVQTPVHILSVRVPVPRGRCDTDVICAVPLPAGDDHAPAVQRPHVAGPAPAALGSALRVPHGPLSQPRLARPARGRRPGIRNPRDASGAERHERAGFSRTLCAERAVRTPRRRHGDREWRGTSCVRRTRLGTWHF
jgi:hypothetical protein